MSSGATRAALRRIPIVRYVAGLVAIVASLAGAIVVSVVWFESEAQRLGDLATGYHQATIQHTGQILGELHGLTHLPSIDHPGHDADSAAGGNFGAARFVVEENTEQVLALQHRYAVSDFASPAARFARRSQRLGEVLRAAETAQSRPDEVVLAGTGLLVATLQLERLHEAAYRESGERTAASIASNRLVVVSVSVLLFVTGGLVVGLMLRQIGLLAARQWRALSDLALSDARMRSFLDNSPNEICLKDAELRYVQVNARFRDQTGLADGQVLGRRADEIGLGERGVAELRADREAVAARAVVTHEITVGEGREARTRLVLAFPVFDEHGVAKGVGNVASDITERRRAEQEILQLNATLEERVERRTRELRDAQDESLRNERLATLGRLTATVSHELRNPLGAMRNSLYTLSAQLANADESVAVKLERLDRNIGRCDRIIDEMLGFARTGALSRSPVVCDRWLAEVLDEMDVPEGVTVERELALGDLTVSIDAERMRRAIVNVYDNACQAMLSGRRDRAPAGSRLRVATAATGRRVEIEVSDTGSGISEDAMPRIFEPLFSTKGFGVGLGLPVVRQVLEQHGGGVETRSAVRGETRFVLWLPLDDAAPEVPDPATAAGAAASTP